MAAVHEGGGEAITEREGRRLVILAARPQLTVTLSRYAAGQTGTDPHVHRSHADAFYVLDGALMLTLGAGGDRIELPAGGFAAVPPNVVHAFHLDRDATWLNIHAPDGGFAAYLRSVRSGAPSSWDSFDPPADGGRPAAEAIVVAAGEGEPVRGGVLKGGVPDLCVVEWDSRPDLRADERRADLYHELGDGRRMLGIHAPDGGLGESLRRAG